jgi:vitamin B12 transporter
MPALPIDTNQIVITASRAPQPEAETAASVTVIDQSEIDDLGEPLVPSFLRLTPTAAVATSGPAGSLTEVRIRGSEANHTLLFIDGIRANDPAAGDTARFELLNADLASRIEVLRGPQSALWGSDAIGGVIAINGEDDASGFSGAAEGGSFGFRRANASAATTTGDAGLAGAIGWQRDTGIDSFGAPGGDKDAYRNLSGRLRGTVALRPGLRLGAAAFLLTGSSQFDGYDPVTFEHTDTLDNTRNRLGAGRIWAEVGAASSAWGGRLGASFLSSSNRNFLGSEPLNRTSGARRTVDGQVQHRFSMGGMQNQLILAGEAERETFHARGLSSGLSTDQDRTRSHQALTAEWSAKADGFAGDVAVRRDFFNRFSDATTFRASALQEVGGGFSLAGSYAQGMAQPTFFDLYGTFPNNFVGNPNLKPENSRGFEVSARFRRSAFSAGLTGYRQRLHHEIIDVFDFATFLSSTENSAGVSRRWGIEGEVEWHIGRAMRVSANYAFLHATQPDSSTGLQVRERRRPKHSGSISANGENGRWRYGASISYAGSHLDSQEVFPFGIVRVKPYWLVDARVAYAVRPGMELFVRAANLLDAHYQEVAGYHTEGFGAFMGISLRGDRRSSR